MCCTFSLPELADMLIYVRTAEPRRCVYIQHAIVNSTLVITLENQERTRVNLTVLLTQNPAVHIVPCYHFQTWHTLFRSLALLSPHTAV